MANIQLASNLRKYRKAHGLTQDRLSARLNISRQAYSNYETAKRDPDISMLIRLCELYGLTMEQLIIQPFNSNYIIHETSSYVIASEDSSENSLILSNEEMLFLLNYREASNGTRETINKLLNL